MARKVLSDHNAVQYLNELLLDPAINSYKSEARRQLIQYASENKDARLLDLGCGSGVELAALAKEIPHCALVGVDPSADFVNATREACKGELWDVAAD